jgi:Ca2+-binding RTX toxin-like protein
MRRRTWLTGVGLMLALGPGASSAIAAGGEASTSPTQLRYEATETGVAGDDVTNVVTISREGENYRVTDTSGITSGNVGAGCRVQFDQPPSVLCPAAGITSIQVQLKTGGDTLTVNSNVVIPVTVTGGPGDDTLNGGSGNDAIRGDAGRDTVRGFAGDDRIDTQGLPGGAEADVINCGAGNDTAIIDGFDGFEENTSTPPGGCEQVNPSATPGAPPPPPAGGPGPSPFQPAVNPVQPGGNVPSTVPPAPRDTSCRANTFVGTAANDRFLGTPSGDRMVGLGGNDLMDGLAGEDCLFGQAGIDTMRGGDGDDRLSGGDGNDRGDGGNGADGIYGSAGVDTLYGRAGNDLVSGGLGSDRLYGEAGADRMTGSAGNDRISAGAGNDRIVAGTGRDQVYGSSGNDLIDVRDGSRDVVSCGPGRDTVVRDRRDVLRNCERRASRLPRAR